MNQILFEIKTVYRTSRLQTKDSLIELLHERLKLQKLFTFQEFSIAFKNVCNDYPAVNRYYNAIVFNLVSDTNLSLSYTFNEYSALGGEDCVYHLGGLNEVYTEKYLKC